MENSTLFLTPVQTVKFLPLFQYLNVLGDIFYTEQLLTKENKSEPFLIVNAFYEHLNRVGNDAEATRKIVQKCLEGSDFYGGQENETLDMEYVNRTMGYIITNVVFSQTGNLFGYLAEIVRTSPSLKLSVFRKTILENLSYLRHLNDNGKSSKLTELATIRIAENLLWSLFPDPPHDMEIIAVEYIYALAGYSFAQSAQLNLSDVSFQQCAILAMTIEASVIGGKLPNSTFQIFSLPALLFYAYKELEKFNQKTTKHLIKDENFWADAFFTLFTYLNSTFEAIRQQALETNSVYQFHLVLSNFKNRTTAARDVIHQHCNRVKGNYLKSLIDEYKTFSRSTHCPGRTELLPDLELNYTDQFSEIKERYRLLEMDFLRSAFDEIPLLRNLINSTNTVVYESGPELEVCYYCISLPQTYKSNINLFAIKTRDIEHFALEHNENNVSILIQKDNKSEFNKRVGLPQATNLAIGAIPKFFKRRGKNFDNFVENIAEMKAEQFKDQLFKYGYDQTSMEKFFEIIKAFIPFYNCAKYANAGIQDLAALSCFGDIVSLMPFGKFVNIGFKISTTVADRFIIASGLTLRTFTLRQAILTILTTGLQNSVKSVGEILTKVVFTKQMFKSLSLTIVRVLDPGFELFGKLVWHGSALIGKVLKTTLKHVGKRFEPLKFEFSKFERIWQHLEKKGVKPSDDSELISLLEKMEGREVFRLIYPGGENPFGPKFIRLSSGHAELRRIVGFQEASPVVISRIFKQGKVFYRKVNLQTEKSYGLELRINKHGLLENHRQPFRQHIFKIKKEGFGGRGAARLKREDSISKAVELVVDANIGYSRVRAEIVMRHYVLTFDNPTVNDLADLEAEPVDFSDFEIEDFLQEHVIGIDGALTMDPVLSKYLAVPTYYDFALDWIRTRQINPTYDSFFVWNFKMLQKLMYADKMDQGVTYGFKKLMKETFKVYGWNHLEKGHEYLESIRNSYKAESVSEHLSFQDYYALYVWEQFGFQDVENKFISMQIQKSLYRLAVRQATSTSNGFSKILYNLEIRIPSPLEHDLSQLKEIDTVSIKMHLSTSEEEIYKEMLEYKISQVASSGTSHQIFMYEVHVDSYLAVDLSSLISKKDKFVLLPDVSYIIRSPERRKVVGCEVNYIVMHSKPIVKEAIIAKLLNNIQRYENVIG